MKQLIIVVTSIFSLLITANAQINENKLNSNGTVKLGLTGKTIGEEVSEFHKNADFYNKEDSVLAVLTSHNINNGYFYPCIIYTNKKVFTWKEVPDWAEQNSSWGELTANQYSEVEKLLHQIIVQNMYLLMKK